MLEGLDRLVSLQQLDGELRALESEHAAIPGQRKAIAEEREAGEVRLTEAGEALQQAEIDQRRSESELQDQEALLHKLEGQQNQVKSNVAYTALLHEMEQARRAISTNETGILESMEAIEAASAQLAAVQGGIEATRSQLVAREQDCEARQTELAARIQALRGGRETLCTQLSADMLATYQKIAAKREPALVLVTGELCTGCQVGVPAQDFIEVLKAEKLITCGNCRRILLHADKVAASAAG